MKKLFALQVRGARCRWSISIFAEPEHVADWRADGLVVHEIENTIPAWLVALGKRFPRLRLVRVYCFLQDIANLKNPFCWRRGRAR